MYSYCAKKFCKLSNKRLDIVVYTVKVWRMFSFYTTKQANRHQRRAASGWDQNTRRALLAIASRTGVLSEMKHSEASSLPLVTLKCSPVVMMSETKHLALRLLVILNAAQRSEESGPRMISTFRSVRYFLSAGQIPSASSGQALRSAQDDKRSADHDNTNRLGGNGPGKSEEDQE